MSIRISRSAALAVALTLIAPGAATAAWQAETIPGTTGASPPNSFAFDRQGRGSIVFEGFDQRRFTGLALRAAGGGWTRQGNLAGIGFGAARTHLYAQTRALLVTRDVTGYGPFHRARFRLVWALGRTEGGFGSFRQIDRSADVPASAANAAGDALVAYTPQGGTGVRVSERRAGRDFGRPTVLGANGSIAPTVAVNALGDRVVAWYRGNRLEARVRTAGGRWSPVRTVATVSRSDDAPLRALVTPDRRVVVAWHAVTVREGQPVRVEAGAVTRRIHGGWHSALLERSLLDSESFGAAAAAIPLVTTSGTVLVAWTGRWRAATGVRIAQVSASGSIHGPTLVSGESQVATLDDAAAGPDGRVAVTFAEHLAAGVRTWAALGTGIDAFQPPEPLTPEGENGLVGSRVAFSPLTGQAVAVRPRVSAGRAELTAAVN